MPKVVETRLATWSTLPAKTSVDADLLERVFKRADVNSLPVPSQKECGVSLFRPGAGITPIGVFCKNHNRLGANGHKAALEELRIANSEYGVGQIHVCGRQRERLGCAQRGTVHERKKGTHHEWIEAVAVPLIRCSGIQKTAEFSERVDVWLERRWPFRDNQR
jgi:hypothetical protein